MIGTVGFILLAVFLIVYVVTTPRKEFPIVVIFHALLQYGLTLAMWFLFLGRQHAIILMLFLWLSTLLLIWARSVNYSNELLSIRLFFSISQWAVLLMLGLFLALESPYYYVTTASSQGVAPHFQHISLRPIIKLGANFLLFTTFFQLTLNWGQKWPLLRSLIDLGPILLYVGLMGILRSLMSQQMGFPHT
ncbi:MAG: hypothetical protein AAFW00_20695 [Bacteroidota bacterium]